MSAHPLPHGLKEYHERARGTLFLSSDLSLAFFGRDIAKALFGRVGLAFSSFFHTVRGWEQGIAWARARPTSTRACFEGVVPCARNGGRYRAYIHHTAGRARSMGLRALVGYQRGTRGSQSILQLPFKEPTHQAIKPKSEKPRQNCCRPFVTISSLISTAYNALVGPMAIILSPPPLSPSLPLTHTHEKGSNRLVLYLHSKQNQASAGLPPRSLKPNATLRPLSLDRLSCPVAEFIWLSHSRMYLAQTPRSVTTEKR